jgi:phosphoribosylaminoimidazolecarboxamide formyltransferase/IMP cyclohydrolase
MAMQAEDLLAEDSTSAKLIEVIRAENGHQGMAGLYEAKNDNHPLSPSKYAYLTGATRSSVGVTDFGSAQHALVRAAAGLEQTLGSVAYIAIAVKHGKVCGGAYGDDPEDVMRLTITGDDRAVFGGVLITNFEINEEIAKIIKTATNKSKPPQRVMGAVYAPNITSEAVELLKRRRDACYMAVNPLLADVDSLMLDTEKVRIPVFSTSYIEQERSVYIVDADAEGYKVYGKALTKEQFTDLVFGAAICDNTESNTIVAVKNRQVIGNRGGGVDRVGAAEGVLKMAYDAGHDIEGAIIIGDSFFPFTDGIEVLINAKVDVIYATLGSDRDLEVIAACEAAGVTFVTMPDSGGRMFSRHNGG